MESDQLITKVRRAGRSDASDKRVNTRHMPPCLLKEL